MNNIKNKLNIVGRAYVKENSAGGEILSFLPDVPISGWLDDFVFILTIPEDKYAPAYMRLARKNEGDLPNEEVSDFDQIKAIGYIKENRQKKGDIIICAPKKHAFVDFSKIVIIATIPSPDKNYGPVYIRKKIYDKNKSETSVVEGYQLINDNSSDLSLDHVDEMMREFEE